MIDNRYGDSVDIMEGARSNEGGHDTTGYERMDNIILPGRGINDFATYAVSTSGFTPIPKTYAQLIDQWAQEYQRRKHVLTQGEIESLDSKVYLDLLETQNKLP